MALGIYSVQDLQEQRFAIAKTIGLETINEVFQAQLAYDVAEVNELIGDLCQKTYAQQGIWGTQTSGTFSRVDQYGKDLPHKQMPGIQGDFPLYRNAFQLGWNDAYFRRATGAEVAKMFLEVRDAYFRTLIADMRIALFRHANITPIDWITNGVTLAVKRLWNNDGVVPPPSPAGVAFAGAHQHYAAATPITEALITTLVANVTEHGNTKGLKLCMPLSSKAAFVTACTTQYLALSKPYVLELSGTTTQTSIKLNPFNMENQLIGFYGDGVEVWVKPYMPANLYMCVATGMPNKPLMYRQVQGQEGMILNAPYPDFFPLYADDAIAEYGFGVWDRGMAALHLVAANYTTDPV